MLRDGEAGGVVVGETEGDRDGVRVEEKEGEEDVSVDERDGVLVGEQGEAVEEGVPVDEGEGVLVGEQGEAVGEGVPVDEGDVGEKGDAVEEGVPVGDQGEAVEDAVPVGEGVGDGVSAEGVLVGEGDNDKVAADVPGVVLKAGDEELGAAAPEGRATMGEGEGEGEVEKEDLGCRIRLSSLTAPSVCFFSNKPPSFAPGNKSLPGSARPQIKKGERDHAYAFTQCNNLGE